MKQSKISDEAVKAKTGKKWSEWFKILDKADAVKMSHPQIASYLFDKMGLPAWWSQMVANQYEQHKGVRKKHQTTDGYQISATKTLDVPLEKIYVFWENKSKRKLWLNGDILEITTANKNKSLRGKWADTRIDVGFYAKGEGKSQVALGHNKLPTPKEAEKMKKFWGNALNRLKELLEK